MKIENGYKQLMVLLAVFGGFGLLQALTSGRNSTCDVRATAPAASTNQAKGKRAMSNATAVSTADFDREVLEAKEPVLVDFWAPWCMPCRMLAPTVDELAAEYVGRVKVVKVNTDENQDLAAKYGIRGIPTLIVFKAGEPVDRVVGVQPKTALAEKLDSATGK